jgi:ribosomal-protein-alanine N-acetyltransferase
MGGPSEKIGTTQVANVRRMSASDSTDALSILRESPEASIWSKESLLVSVSEGNAWAAELDGRVVGILIGRVAADEFEILNLAVAMESRRRGIATQLVSATLEYARSSGARQAYLEVRASNEGATALYARLGFRICGQRPNYYRNPPEDAVLLVLNI